VPGQPIQQLNTQYEANARELAAARNAVVQQQAIVVQYLLMHALCSTTP
jgi:hypothetical protein